MPCAEAENHARHHQSDHAVDEAGRERGAGPDHAADGQRLAWAEFVRNKSADNLEQQIRVSESREDEAGLHLGQRNFLEELVRGHDRADVHPVDISEEVHQTKQPEHDVGGFQYSSLHGWPPQLQNWSRERLVS